MCGIGAVSRAKPSSIPHLKAFAVALARELEHRGPDATGFAWCDDLGHPWYWKAPGRARDVARLCPLPDGRQELIIHDRWATHGDPKINENNHPVTAPGMTLVHNGVCDNYKDIFELLDIDPETECDTEAIVNLLAFGPGLMDAEPWELLELIEGSATLAWLDADEPHVMHLARQIERPMHIGWTKRGDLVMASTGMILKATARKTGVDIDGIRSVPEGTYLRVEQGEITDKHTFRVPEHKFSVQRPAPRGRVAQRSPRLQSPPRQLTLPVGHDDLVQQISPHRLEEEAKRRIQERIDNGEQTWSESILEWERNQ